MPQLSTKAVFYSNQKKTKDQHYAPFINC